LRFKAALLAVEIPEKKLPVSRLLPEQAYFIVTFHATSFFDVVNIQAISQAFAPACAY